MTDNSRPTFFGIGAQKAGTTWLYQVLSSYEDCAPLPVKEVHFFDHKYLPGPEPAKALIERFNRLTIQVRRLERAVREELEGEGSKAEFYQDGFLAGAELEERIGKLIRLAERLRVHDTPSYVEYVEAWRARNPGKLIGEITPAYSLLPAEGFKEIDSLFNDARFIFIMRDPLDRFWSQARFFVSMRGKQDDPNELLPRLVKRDDFMQRSDYKATIQSIESVVPASRIHYAFFEQVTAIETVVPEMRRLEEFLGLAPMEDEKLLPFVGKPANVSPKSAMSSESRALLLEKLEPVYSFVKSKFGALPAGWAEA